MKAEENDRLCRVGRGTPGGEMLRRYWHPIGLTADLRDRPKLVKILGEELVLFRKPDGSCGLIGSRCPHRGAALTAGYVEERGLRCPYHGWLFSSSGQCLEQPCEPPDSRFKDRIHQANYPVEELGGMIFTYMGPEPRPLLPRFDVLVDENGQRRVSFARYVPANWLQMVDNHQDPEHTTFLHVQMQPWTERPVCHYVNTSLGSMSIQVRTGPRPNTKYVRETHYFAPNGLKVCIPGQDHEDFSAPTTRRFAWVVPMDDYQSVEWEVLFAPFDTQGLPTTFKYEADPSLYRMNVPQPYQEYIHPGSSSAPIYSADGAAGATVILRQDTLIQASQGSLQPREDEHLGVSDKGVVKLRRVVAECIDRVAAGKDPIGIIRDPRDNVRVVVEAAEEVISDEEFGRLMEHGGLFAARAAKGSVTPA